MREAYIKKLIRLVEESKIESLEISSWGRKIKITQTGKSSSNGHNHNSSVLEQVVYSSSDKVSSQSSAASAPATPQPVPAAAADTGKTVAIKSPMVGTFYSAPSPEAAPYVSANQKINVGQVVCIVEAMKLMNEIESEYSGRVVKVLVENATPVEFGQDLYLIEPE